VVPTIGLSYRPIPQVVFKFDYQYERASTGLTANRWNVGVGYMF
jgi:opacity protein-like surface antigen